LLVRNCAYSSVGLSCLSCFFIRLDCFSFFFFFNDTATTEIYTLSLHDALPIFTCSPVSLKISQLSIVPNFARPLSARSRSPSTLDRKSTRLNSSHVAISYAVFCLKKKKKHTIKVLQ